MAENMDPAPAERLEKWPDDQIHRVRVSERMLEELFAYGMTTTAGTSLVGPELLVLETVHDAEEAVADSVDELLNGVDDE